MPCDVAKQVLSGQTDEKVRNHILKCDLCGLCVQSCPEQLDIPKLVIAARQVLIEKGITDVELYRPMWVDHDWNAFTIYRDTYQIDYSNLIEMRCDTLFFPGCVLSSYAPELTRAAVRWLADQGGQVGLSLQCCGQPLAQIGLTKRAEYHLKLIWQMAHETGTHRLVTACPGCDYQLHCGSVPGGIEVVSLFQLMADAGVRASGLSDGKITIHDSCPDREQQRIGPRVREMLSDYEIGEMAHHGRETHCCGSGGIVSIIDPELCICRAERRLKEFREVGAHLCVTYCIACASGLSSVFEPGKVRYLLELIFNQSVDYARNRARMEAMWQGEQGEYNYHRLESSLTLGSSWARQLQK